MWRLREGEEEKGGGNVNCFWRACAASAHFSLSSLVLAPPPLTRAGFVAASLASASSWRFLAEYGATLVSDCSVHQRRVYVRVSGTRRVGCLNRSAWISETFFFFFFFIFCRCACVCVCVWVTHAGLIVCVFFSHVAKKKQSQSIKEKKITVNSWRHGRKSWKTKEVESATKSRQKKE